MEVDVEKAATWGTAIIGAVATAAGTAWKLVTGHVAEVRGEVADVKRDMAEKFKDVDSEIDADRAAANRARERLHGRLDDIQREQREANDKLRADLKGDFQTMISLLRHPTSTP